MTYPATKFLYSLLEAWKKNVKSDLRKPNTYRYI